MRTVFFVIAAVMIAVALSALLLPLVRQGHRSGRSRGVFSLALTIAFVLPLAAAGLYLLIGTPVALNGVSVQPEQPLTIDQAIGELRAHLAEQPDDLQGWMLLAQTSNAQHDPTAARDAYDHALKLDANNADAMVGWAEADSMISGNHMIDGRALDLLRHAVLLQPNSQRGLWLLGISNFQHGQYRDAAATWRLLQPQLEPGSQVARSVAEQIAVADSRADASSAGPSDSRSSAASADAGLKVLVTLAPALKNRLAAGDTLFVYARAENGPPMPLAVARLEARRLPASITLTDAMAMTPTMKLSSAARVFVGARISHSGQPIAQPGDLEGSAGIVAADRKTPVTVRIDKVH